MARVDYNPFEGYALLAKAGQHLDMQSVEVLTFHAALEHEIDIVLDGILPRFGKLGKLGFGQKVGVLNASWKGDADAADKLCDVLLRFNDLRNAHAHGDRGQIAGCTTALINSYRHIDSDAHEGFQIGAIAQGVCGFMGDGPMPTEVAAIAEGLDAVLDSYGKAFAMKIPRVKPKA